MDRALSQEELAYRAGISRTTVMRAELGKHIRPSTLRSLARVLRVQPSKLQRPT